MVAREGEIETTDQHRRRVGGCVRPESYNIRDGGCTWSISKISIYKLAVVCE